MCQFISNLKYQILAQERENTHLHSMNGQKPALTINVPADPPQMLTPPPTPVPSSPVHLHAEHTDDHVEPPLTPLPMNASPVKNTTSNVVSPSPSDSEHVEEAPIRP